MRNIRPFQEILPTFGERVYIDEASTVIGKVTLGDDCSIWPNVVLRGDVNKITIGDRTNIQDGSVLHVSHPTKEIHNGYPLHIGADVTVGHQVMLHGCTIKDRVLIGMSSVVLDGVVIEEDVLIGAGALVPPDKVLVSGYLYLGAPAKQIRELTLEEIDNIMHSAQYYVGLKKQYLSMDNTRELFTQSEHES